MHLDTQPQAEKSDEDTLSCFTFRGLWDGADEV